MIEAQTTGRRLGHRDRSQRKHSDRRRHQRLVRAAAQRRRSNLEAAAQLMNDWNRWRRLAPADNGVNVQHWYAVRNGRQLPDTLSLYDLGILHDCRPDRRRYCNMAHQVRRIHGHVAQPEVEQRSAVPDFSLEGKTALVTGGSRGIGKAVALALAARGADVGVTCFTGCKFAEDVRGQIRDLGRRAEYFAHDVGDAAEVVEAGRRSARYVRRHRHPGEQRRHRARPVVQEDDARDVGHGHRRGPYRRVYGHEAVHRRHGRPRLGPRDQHQQHRRRGGQLRPGQLRGRQGGRHRADEDAGPRVRPQRASRSTPSRPASFARGCCKRCRKRRWRR